MSEDDKHIEEMLQSDFANIKIIMDTSPDMMCFTKNSAVMYMNTTWLNFTGRQLTDELGEGRFNYIHKDDVIYLQEAIESFLINEEPYRVKYRVLLANGQYKWVVEDGRSYFSPDGGPLGFISKCVDIDKEKKIEIKLHAAETKYRRLFETAYDGVLILNFLTGEITDVNPFLIKLLGYSNEEFIGKKLWDVGAFKNIRASKEAFKALQETGYTRYEDLPLETVEGKLIPVEFVSNAYMTGDRKVIQCNIRDISIRKKAEMTDKALTTLMQEKQKNAFIADVTHELRTPLAIIKGNVELALRAKKVTNKKTFQAINLEINHLTKMIIDLAVLTNENQDLQRKIIQEKVDLSLLLTDVVKRLQVISSTKDISISIVMPTSVDILGDSNYLGKLFSNIISNGIYYGKKGGVIKIKGKEHNKQLIVTVMDDGIGISKEELPNIFERFYRTLSAREVNDGGTGLGLAMSKWIAEAHSGTITVASEENKGTTFTITLPLFL